MVKYQEKIINIKINYQKREHIEKQKLNLKLKLKLRLKQKILLNLKKIEK